MLKMNNERRQGLSLEFPQALILFFLFGLTSLIDVAALERMSGKLAPSMVPISSIL